VTKHSHFQTIGLLAKQNAPESKETLRAVLACLEQHRRKVFIEEKTAEYLDRDTPHKTLDRHQLGERCDLVIVIGGDGSMLNAARILTQHGTPVLGINRGGLGFLTDVAPSEVEESLTAVLHGHYSVEVRFLLHTSIWRDEHLIGSGEALNDCVLYSGDIARMIEFEVYIAEQFVYSLRGDGLITATPTGSTAYALSGGGPILSPSLDAMVLVPMHPHTLTSRPIVVDSRQNIRLLLSPGNEIYPRVSCDGQIHISCAPGDEIRISRHPQTLHLIHPPSYDYYNVLRGKLNWGTKLNYYNHNSDS
jgi:NAD+ kinase